MDSGFGAPGMQEIVVILVIFLMMGVALVLPLWFICKKAGLHPALSLIALIPYAIVILLFILAFAKWPALENRDTDSGN